MPAFNWKRDVSLVEDMKEIMPVYCVIGKIPAVRNISNGSNLRYPYCKGQKDDQ